MDDKTEELRNIFLDVADDPTLTEHQHDTRGSLAAERDIDTELATVVGEMRERYEFTTDLDDSMLIELLKRFYDGDTDEALAGALDIDDREVIRARLDLHLVRPKERDAPFDVSAADRAVASGETVDSVSDRLDISESTLRRYLRIYEVELRSRQANQRFRDAFDSILADAELSARMVRDVHEDGLKEATEGLESNVSF